MQKSNVKYERYDPTIFTKVRSLYQSGLTNLHHSNKELDLPEGTVEIDDLDTDEAHKRLHEIIDGIVAQSLITGRPIVNVPSRSSNNIIWDEINDLLLMGEKTTAKSLLSLTSVVDVTRLVRVIEIIHELIEKDMHARKREVFYHDVNLFKDQKNSDVSIEDASALLHATRNSTHVVAAAKGVAIGCLKIRDGNDIIDLEEQGNGGWAISPHLDSVEIIESSAEMVLVVEKDAAMSRLAEAKWYKKWPSVILTGKGMADIATRMFLKRLSKLGLPVFVLVDADSYGFSIASVFKQGSKKLSYESPFLATQNINLLGLLHRDLDNYKIPKEVRIPMTKADINKAKQLIAEDYIPNAWKKDLKEMIKDKTKAEIQALSSKGFEFLTEEYLPRKLETGDWI